MSSYDKDEKASATCGYAFWDRKNGYAYMVENPAATTQQGRHGIREPWHVAVDDLRLQRQRRRRDDGGDAGVDGVLDRVNGLGGRISRDFLVPAVG